MLYDSKSLEAGIKLGIATGLLMSASIATTTYIGYFAGKYVWNEFKE